MRWTCICPLPGGNQRTKALMELWSLRGLLQQLPHVPWFVNSGFEEVWTNLWHVCCLPRPGPIPPLVAILLGIRQRHTSPVSTSGYPLALCAPPSWEASLQGAQQCKEVREPFMAPSFPSPQPGLTETKPSSPCFGLVPLTLEIVKGGALGCAEPLWFYMRSALLQDNPGNSRMGRNASLCFLQI